MKRLTTSNLENYTGGARHLNALECGYLAGSALVLGVIATPIAGLFVAGLAAGCYAKL